MADIVVNNKNKTRLDIKLVELGIFDSREKAKIAIMEGLVFVNNQKEDKAGTLVKNDAIVEFAENMYCDGYKNIKNIDISHNVIKSMSERNKGMEGLTYEVMDVRELKYDDNSFDLAVDKSTIDALLCGEDAFINVAKMIKEVQRVLKVGGYYMIVSYGSPEYRVLHLNRKFEKFKIEILKIEKDFVEEDGYDKHHYIYLCQKLEGADEISQKYFDSTLDELIKQQILEEEAEEQEENDKEENKEIKIEKTKDINKEEIAKNVFIQNENDVRQTNMGTSVKIELSKKDKTENKTKDEDSKNKQLYSIHIT